MIFAPVSFFALENQDTEPPVDRFRVAISPFYLEDSDEADFVTAEALKNQIENTAKDRIEVTILDAPPIKDKENAIQKGKKAGAHLTVYGGEKRVLGRGTQIEFYVVPTNSEIGIPETIYTSKEGSSEFKSAYYKYTDEPVVIVESLKENVSSAVYTICAFGYYERSEYDSALKTFRCINNYGNDESILFYVASCYNFRGDLSDSLDYNNKILELDSQNSVTWNNKGVVLDKLGDYKEALIAFNKAIEINPQYSVAYNNKGSVLAKLGNYEEALDACNKSTEIDPQNSDAWYNKGVILGKLGRYKEALDACNKSIELNPEYSVTWYNKGVILGELGNYKDAIDAFDKAIELDPQSSEAWNNKGVALGKLGNYEEETEAYNKAIELNPEYSDALYNRARTYSIMKNKDQALLSLKSAIELNPLCKEIAKNDGGFKYLWGDEGFKKLTE
ncbi:MAG TPA: tetratricopeptide repeat protein [Methanosarcina sp.]|nr:tetratricopeptide repeat protein [Methanosarcina sp.]